MSDDIAMLTAETLLAAFRAGELSPVDATRAALDRIERFNTKLNAFNLVDPEGALAAAGESQERWRLGVPRGRLDGCPVSIKDLLLTQGWPTLRGSKAIDRQQDWDEDAPAVARLKEHGAVLLGKTTSPEFGWKGVTDSPLDGITRNPWNPATTPGGSSGGAAAAVAAGMGPLALGTDGGGSVRIPAGFTGIYGLKPSFGRIPAYPLSPFGTVSHIGPMTRSVADAALLLSVLAEPDPRDAYGLPYDGSDYQQGLDDGIEGLRVAFSPSLGGHQVDPEVAALVAKAAWAFADLGAKVELAEPDLSGSDQVFRCLWYAGAANLMRRFDAAAQEEMDPGFREIAAEGARYSLLDYLAAVGRREELTVATNLFHTDYDLLITPSLPIEAFDAGVEVPAGRAMTRWPDWTPFSYPFNLTQQPAASLPCGLTAAGLPIGLQIVGPRYADALVLRASRAFEAAFPWSFPDLETSLA
ncbi:amidase [Pelagibius litoralis]|uniref:Amidase n=1 Tax=Pelagibius litoralis TaxID=374515 RepID=A0A967EZE4_9PROT|nr:amidase [Pelagibius litoralis]NIA70190.1 amidase [Pelagibius litoralis]